MSLPLIGGFDVFDCRPSPPCSGNFDCEDSYTMVDGRPEERVTKPLTDIDAAVRAQIEAQALVGVGIGIAVGDEVVYTKGYGYEDIADDYPVLAKHTLFRWASVSKTLTAILALQLAREGVLDLDADIDRIWPDYVAPSQWVDAEGALHTLAPNARHITARQLLGHLGGIMHYTNGVRSPIPWGTNDRKTNTGIEWAVREIMSDPLVQIPGTAYAYSTIGYNLLGVILEQASGQLFADLAVERVVSPLELSSLRPDYEWLDIAQRATGYLRVLGHPVDVGSSDVSWKLPGGGFLSTVQDFTRYCAALGGSTLLDPSSKASAWTSQRTNDGTQTGYGLGFDVGSRNGRQFVAHGGSQQKVETYLRYYPDDDLCVVVMTNTEQADPRAVALAIEDAWRAP